MQIDGSTGVITFFLLGIPRPGAVKSPTALVVSSDATTRRHAADLVKRAGFTPITVDDPYRALTVAAESPQEISLLITDASFDVMSCVELHDDVKLRHAEIRAIYLSGAPVFFGNASDSDWAILRSPLSPKALNSVLSSWGLGKLDALPPERQLNGRQRCAKYPIWGHVRSLQ
jgi:CheY-like chemotaxis protein